MAPGTVDFSKIKTKNIYKFNQLENLNTVLDAAKRIGCNIVNISAEDIIARKARRDPLLSLTLNLPSLTWCVV